MDCEDPLEVSGHSLELHTEAAVGRNRHAPLPFIATRAAPSVVADLKTHVRRYTYTYIHAYVYTRRRARVEELSLCRLQAPSSRG